MRGRRLRRQPSSRVPKLEPVVGRIADHRHGRPAPLGLGDRLDQPVGDAGEPIRPLVQLVLPSAVTAAAAGLMALAHRTPPSDGAHAATRSAPRSRALRERGLDLTSAALGRARLAQRSKAGLAAADADRDLRWADAAPLLGGDEALDDAVLQRVVAQHHEAAARLEEASEAARPASRAPSSSLTAMRRAWKTRVAGWIRRVSGARHRPAHEGRELLGRLDRRRGPRLDDHARDAAGERLLAVLAEEVGQLARRSIVASRSAAGRPRLVSKRMSRRPPARKPKPRSVSPSW